MTTRLHFISGLPRSSSTLLAGILRQNPHFHAAMTSPIGGLFSVMLNAMSRGNETALFIDETQRQELLAALLETYYRPQQDKDVIFNTNRVWCALLPALLSLFPEAIRSNLLVVLPNERVRCPAERRRQHPARPVPGDLGQRIHDRSG